MSIRELSVHPAHGDSVWCVDWSVAGEILTASVDESVKAWTVSAGDDTTSMRVEPKPRLTVGAQTVLSASHLAEGQVLPLSSSHAILSVVSIPRSSLFVSSTMDGVLRVYDREKAEHVRRIEGAQGPLETWTLAADPSGTFVAAGSKSGAVHVFSVASGEKVATLAPPEARAAAAEAGSGAAPAASAAPATAAFAHVMSVAWSPDGGAVAAGHFDGRVSLWNLHPGTTQLATPTARALTPHTRAVRALRFAADSSLLFSGGDDHHVHWYDVSSAAGTGQMLHDLVAHMSWVTSIDLPFASSGALPSAGASSSSSAAGSGVLSSLTPSVFATTSSDKKLKIWSLLTKECIAVVEMESGGWSIAYDPSGEKIAVGTEQGKLAVFSVPSQ